MMRRLSLPLLLAAASLFLAAPAQAALKPLAPGSKGDRVAAMQTYLADQGYLPWAAVDGSYDYRTEQALMAFQGWNGLERTGRADVKTLKRMVKAHAPRPWKRYKGRRIEVHVAKQVALLVSKRGRVIRAIHVSTGAGGRTPKGDFKIYRKEMMSWSVPFSVWLPYASYITGGIAFHEYGSVPGYPASHGCIRVPSPEAPVMWDFATLGTPTHVHA
jgi:peptidoglycan hydrolase-like protein with peptidoglycan-binding domain